MSELQNKAGQQASPNQTIIINQQPAKKINRIGIAGFVIALIGFFLSWVPGVGWILWLLGFVFSFAGVFKKPEGLAFTGLGISLLVLMMLKIGAISSIIETILLLTDINTGERNIIMFFAVVAIVAAVFGISLLVLMMLKIGAISSIIETILLLTDINMGERNIIMFFAVVAIVAAVFGIFIGWLARTIGDWKIATGRGLLASITGGIIGCGAGLFICYIYDEIQYLQYAKAYSSAVDLSVMMFLFGVFGTIVGAILGNMIAKATQSKRS